MIPTRRCRGCGAMGVTTSCWRNWERGRAPPIWRAGATMEARDDGSFDRHPASRAEHGRRFRPAHRHSPAFPGRAAVADRDGGRVGATAASDGFGGRAFHTRRRHLGHQHPRQLGLCDPQLCLVARHRTRRHADIRVAAADPERVAQFAQPLRRDHDAVRRGLRRDLSGAASRPTLVSLLDVSLSGDHGRVAAIPQPAGMGHLGGADLSHGVAGLLVHRPHSGPGRGARPRHQTRLADLLRHHLARLARFGRALAALVAGLSADGGTCCTAGRLRAQRGVRCCSRPGKSPAGTRRSSRLTS